MNSRIIAIFVLSIALIFAVVIGTNVALGEYDSLSTYAIVAIIVYFVVRGWRNVWWFAALLIFSGAVFVQGFVFEGDHLFILMVVLATILGFVNGQRTGMPSELRAAGSGFTRLVLGCLLAYGVLHFLGNYAFPYSPGEYSLRTALKAYFECYASMGCFFWLLTGSYGFELRKNWSRLMVLIIFVALAGNLSVRLYMFLIGFQAADGLSESGLDAYVLNVPIINMQAGIYTLRFLCPLAVVVLLMAASMPGWWRERGKFIQFLVVLSVLMAIAGATFSGGRATLLFCLVLAICVAIVRRKVGLVALLGVGAALVVALANLFAYDINTRAPYYVARSLQMVMWEKGATYETINESQLYRNAAIKASLEDWNQDNRTRFTGRSVYLITSEDAEFARNFQGMDGFVANALRSGRTHNMITDLLLQYGAIGLVLYVLSYLAVIRYYWAVAARIPHSEPFSRALADAMKVYLPLTLVYQALGGGFMPMFAALAIGLIRANLVARSKTAVATALTEAHPPATSPRGRAPLRA